jgi:CRISPR type I-F-associated protein Csy3
MPKTKKTSIQTQAVLLPDMLSYARSFQVTDGILFAMHSDGSNPPRPIVPSERKARGANAPHLAILRPEDVPAEAKASEESNRAFQPSLVLPYHYACLPPGYDVLEMRWRLSVSANCLTPTMSNESQTFAGCGRTASQALRAVVDSLSDADRGELAARYLWRIVDGSVLWRNRIAVRSETVVIPEGGAPCIFRPPVALLARFPGMEQIRTWADRPDRVDELHRALRTALFEPGCAVSWTVRTRTFPGHGAEVWPSQLILNDAEREKYSRRYFVRDALDDEGNLVHTAALTSQKVANRIRRIDEWHGHADLGAICVEHYGYEMSESKTWRQEGRHIYDLLQKVLAGIPTTREENLYIVAMLIRGAALVKNDRAAQAGKDGGAQQAHQSDGQDATSGTTDEDGAADAGMPQEQAQ